MHQNCATAIYGTKQMLQKSQGIKKHLKKLNNSFTSKTQDKNIEKLITTLKKGTISIIKAGGENESFETNGGIVEVLNNKVIVLAE